MPHGGVVGAEDTPPADGDCNIALRDQKGTGTGEGLMRIQRLGFFDGSPRAALRDNGSRPFLGQGSTGEVGAFQKGGDIGVDISAEFGLPPLCSRKGGGSSWKAG